MKPSFAIVGCGRVGTALGRNLINAGYALTGLSCKTMESAQRASSILKISNFTQDSLKITKDTDIVFITTPDGIIAKACDRISQKDGFSKTDDRNSLATRRKIVKKPYRS